MSCTYSLSIAPAAVARRLDVVVDNNYVDMIVLEDGDAEVIQFTWPDDAKVDLELYHLSGAENLTAHVGFVVAPLHSLVSLSDGPLQLELLSSSPDRGMTEPEIEFPQLIGEWK